MNNNQNKLHIYATYNKFSRKKIVDIYANQQRNELQSLAVTEFKSYFLATPNCVFNILYTSLHSEKCFKQTISRQTGT